MSRKHPRISAVGSILMATKLPARYCGPAASGLLCGTALGP
ncbi:MAG: hypothetical protein OXR82_09545 [Gammaproteobacteria bacterium]|nr:hypothetical protein [Gammaproteobacteria bacterium]